MAHQLTQRLAHQPTPKGKSISHFTCVHDSPLSYLYAHVTAPSLPSSRLSFLPPPPPLPPFLAPFPLLLQGVIGVRGSSTMRQN